MSGAAMARVDIVLAWPRRFEAWTVEVDDGATIAEAVTRAGLSKAALEGQGIDGVALHGVRTDWDAAVRDGDRIELLRPLVADPKDARRRRAALKPLK